MDVKNLLREFSSAVEQHDGQRLAQLFCENGVYHGRLTAYSPAGSGSRRSWNQFAGYSVAVRVDGYSKGGRRFFPGITKAIQRALETRIFGSNVNPADAADGLQEDSNFWAEDLNEQRF